MEDFATFKTFYNLGWDEKKHGKRERVHSMAGEDGDYGDERRQKEKSQKSMLQKLLTGFEKSS